MNTPSPTQTIRTSISLPLQLYKQLDALVEARGFRNRSQALREMIHQQLARFSRENGDDIMAGTITLFYDESKANLSTRLSAIQRKHIDEVISSQHVQLENNHTMEVLVVQGPARKLQIIADELVSCKGVTTGGLNLSNIVLPPIHTKSVGDVVPDFTTKDCAVGTTAPTRTQTTSQEHSS
jgi:CopG family nickel-responsive transcriptional regulator